MNNLIKEILKYILICSFAGIISLVIGFWLIENSNIFILCFLFITAFIVGSLVILKGADEK